VDEEQINNIYFPEIEKFVEELTGADKVIVYGCVVRVAKQNGEKLQQPPAADAHVDFTIQEAKKLARELLVGHGDPDYQFKRALHVSNWRAFSPGPQDWPLAVCDARTVKDEEGKTNSIIELDVWSEDVKAPYDVLPELDPAIVTRESKAFPYQPWHKWFYFSNMKRDEVMVFKLNDSDMEGVWRTPHTAFPNDAPDVHPRESVEIRACAYFK